MLETAMTAQAGALTGAGFYAAGLPGACAGFAASCLMAAMVGIGQEIFTSSRNHPKIPELERERINLIKLDNCIIKNTIPVLIWVTTITTVYHVNGCSPADPSATCTTLLGADAMLCCLAIHLVVGHAFVQGEIVVLDQAIEERTIVRH